METRERDDESMEDALRRLTRGPHPSEVAGLFTPEEAEEMKEAVKRLRKNDAERSDTTEREIGPPLPPTGRGLHYCLHCDAYAFVDQPCT